MNLLYICGCVGVSFKWAPVRDVSGIVTCLVQFLQTYLNYFLDNDDEF